MDLSSPIRCAQRLAPNSRPHFQPDPVAGEPPARDAGRDHCRHLEDAAALCGHVPQRISARARRALSGR